MNNKVDYFFTKKSKWHQELNLLRQTVLECGLKEELKWGVPCYTFDNRNIVLMHEFKEYCALLFFKGALLVDNANILVQQTANVQSARQIRFKNNVDIVNLQAEIKKYIREAIELEKSGSKISFKTTAEFNIPEEFAKKLKSEPGLKAAFKALTPGRQRAYLLYFSAPKQSKTRESRIEKSLSLILTGKGLND